MHIAYSVLHSTAANKNMSARYRGYVAACQKHRETIAAIQQYMPGWVPPSPLKGELFSDAPYRYNY